MRGVAELRAALGLTQKDLAEFLQVSTAMVSLVEIHQREFSATTLARFGRLERAYLLTKARIDRTLADNTPRDIAPVNTLPVIDIPAALQLTLSAEEQHVLASALNHPDAHEARRTYKAKLRQKLGRKVQALCRTLAQFSQAIYKDATLDALKADPPTDDSLARLETGWIMVQKELSVPKQASTLRATLTTLTFTIAALEWEIAQADKEQ